MCPCRRGIWKRRRLHRFAWVRCFNVRVSTTVALAIPYQTRHLDVELNTAQRMWADVKKTKKKLTTSNRKYVIGNNWIVLILNVVERLRRRIKDPYGIIRKISTLSVLIRGPISRYAVGDINSVSTIIFTVCKTLAWLAATIILWNDLKTIKYCPWSWLALIFEKKTVKNSNTISLRLKYTHSANYVFNVFFGIRNENFLSLLNGRNTYGFGIRSTRIQTSTYLPVRL